MKRERIKEPLIKGSYVTQYTLAPSEEDLKKAAKSQEDGE